MREQVMRRVEAIYDEIKHMGETELSEWLALEQVRIEHGSSSYVGGGSKFSGSASEAFMGDSRIGAKMSIAAAASIRRLELLDDMYGETRRSIEARRKKDQS